MKIRYLLACLILVITTSAFISSIPDAKPVGPAIDPALAMPSQVNAFVLRSCADCHTNNTRWPWYAKVPPVAWLVHSDVSHARRAMNLSAWSGQNGATRETAIGTLAAACMDVRSGRMPRTNYLWMHPGAKPSAQDIQGFCAWTDAEIAKLTSRPIAHTK